MMLQKRSNHDCYCPASEHCRGDKEFELKAAQLTVITEKLWPQRAVWRIGH